MYAWQAENCMSYNEEGTEYYEVAQQMMKVGDLLCRARAVLSSQ